MDRVDGSNHYEKSSSEEAASLLTIVLDTNPHAWALLDNVLPLSKAVANILVFINAHLAFNNANQVAVIASHSHRAEWLYPRPPDPKATDEDVQMKDAESSTTIVSDANKYRPFALIENDILSSLRALISSTTINELASTTTTQMAGALTLALAFINKASLQYSDLGHTSRSKGDVDPSNQNGESASMGLASRILVISVSGDLANQYIPLMNTTFAAQTMRVPIDILKLAGDTVFLQQASDATKGIYMQPKNSQGLLQYLMTAFLPDQNARAHLIAPTQEMVDFRAACFCHRNVVDVGFVCSICLSIFCTPPEGAVCLTCETHLALGDYGGKPAVVPRKRKKKRKINGVDSNSRVGTPAPGE